MDIITHGCYIYFGLKFLHYLLPNIMGEILFWFQVKDFLALSILTESADLSTRDIMLSLIAPPLSRNPNRAVHGNELHLFINSSLHLSALPIAVTRQI